MAEGGRLASAGGRGSKHQSPSFWHWLAVHVIEAVAEKGASPSSSSVVGRVITAPLVPDGSGATFNTFAKIGLRNRRNWPRKSRRRVVPPVHWESVLDSCGIARELGVAYATARRVIDGLAVAGIVLSSEMVKRCWVYCARGLLEVLDAPLEAG